MDVSLTEAQAEALSRPDVTVEELEALGILVIELGDNPPLSDEELAAFELALQTEPCPPGCPCGGDEWRVQFVDGSWGFYDESYDFRGGYADEDAARAGMREYGLWLEGGITTEPLGEPLENEAEPLGYNLFMMSRPAPEPAQPSTCGCLLPFCPDCDGRD